MRARFISCHAIGNLEDITAWPLADVEECDVVAAEGQRPTGAVSSIPRFPNR